jgi:hypothetical protein
MPAHFLKFDGTNYLLDCEILTPEESQHFYNHSPDGFSHGYGGSGPAQLALAVMLKLTGYSNNYQQFKWKYIAPLKPGEPFELAFHIDRYDILD